jgi:hypothetical protein
MPGAAPGMMKIWASVMIIEEAAAGKEAVDYWCL